MLEISRKLLLAGIGAAALTKEKIEGIVRELIKQGEISKEEGIKLVKEVLQKGEEIQKILEAKIDVGINKAIEKLNIPTRKETQELRGKLEKLIKKVEEITRKKK
jgi:polyhydroxyalkanoate synthesis regulator phasin